MIHDVVFENLYNEYLKNMFKFTCFELQITYLNTDIF